MSTTSKHTPGPWKHEKSYSTDAEDDQQAIMGTDPEHGWVRLADVYSVADAHLIESAPDMLAALEELVAEWDSADFEARENPGYGGLRETGGIIQARAAIAKATGGAA